MNKRIKGFLVVALLAGPPLETAGAMKRQAEPAVSLGVPQYLGAGCPSATVSSALSLNGAALSLLFDSFVVDADAGSPVVRKNCNVEIPLHVASGIRTSIVGVDYRGFNNLPEGARADFSVEYTFSGGTPMLFTTTFTGPLLANYLLQNTLSTANQVWSSCGEDTILRGRKALVVTTNTAGEQASSSVDSVDVVTNDVNRSAGMTFYFQWQTCTTSTTIANQTTPPSSGSSLHPNFIGLSSLSALLLFLTLS